MSNLAPSPQQARADLKANMISDKHGATKQNLYAKLNDKGLPTAEIFLGVAYFEGTSQRPISANCHSPTKSVSIIGDTKSGLNEGTKSLLAEMSASERKNIEFSIDIALQCHDKLVTKFAEDQALGM